MKMLELFNLNLSNIWNVIDNFCWFPFRIKASNLSILPFETRFDHIQFPNIWLIQSSDFKSTNFVSTKQSTFSKIWKPLLRTALFYSKKVIPFVFFTSQPNIGFMSLRSLEQTNSNCRVFQILLREILLSTRNLKAGLSPS